MGLYDELNDKYFNKFLVPILKETLRVTDRYLNNYFEILPMVITGDDLDFEDPTIKVCHYEINSSLPFAADNEIKNKRDYYKNLITQYSGSIVVNIRKKNYRLNNKKIRFVWLKNMVLDPYIGNYINLKNISSFCTAEWDNFNKRLYFNMEFYYAFE